LSAGAENFSLRQCVETGSGARSASYPPLPPFRGGKAAGTWSWPLTI